MTNDSKKIDVALEEYKLLRAEILAQFQNRNQLLAFGSAALAFLIGSGVTAVQGLAIKSTQQASTLTQVAPQQSSSPLLWLAYLIPSIFIPSLCALIIVCWLTDSCTIARIGSYLASREKKINEWLKNSNSREEGESLRWESSLRAKEGNGLWWRRFLRTDIISQSLVITILFAAIAFSSLFYSNVLYSHEIILCPQGISCKNVFCTMNIVLFIGTIWSVWKLLVICLGIYKVADY